MNIESTITKLEFHIRLLAEALNTQEHPIPGLVIEFDWDERQLEKAHDVFEKYDEQLNNDGNSPLCNDLEKELKQEFQISYQSVKSIVNAFYNNGQWQNVCYWFAKGQPPCTSMEMEHILNHRREN